MTQPQSLTFLFTEDFRQIHDDKYTVLFIFSMRSTDMIASSQPRPTRQIISTWLLESYQDSFRALLMRFDTGMIRHATP